MKIIPITLTALVTLSAVSANSATISGQLQAGLLRPIDSTKSATVDELAGSRSSLTVAETADAGDGLKVGAMVQARFSPVTGADKYTDGLFEQVKLDLSGDFGTLAIGKYNTILGTAQGWVAEFGNDGALNSRIPSTDSRLARQIGYKTPIFNGLQAEVVFAAKDTSITGANSTAGSNGLGGKLYNGTVPAVCPATGCVETQNASQFNLNYSEGKVQAFFSYSENNWGNKNIQYGAAYDFGAAKVMLSQQANDASVWGENKRTYTSFAVQAPITSKFSIGFQHVGNDVTNETRDTLAAEFYKTKSLKFMAEAAQNSNRTESPTAALNAASNGVGYFVGISYSF
jgi:hypothetical protein